MTFKLADIVHDLSRLPPVPQRDRKRIDGIAIHHSADEGTPWSWARYHTTSPDQGGPSWGPAACIGYHAAVMRSGQAYKTANDSDRTPGVANHNGHLLHVVCQGNFVTTPPTEAQFTTLLKVVRTYMQAYAIPIQRVRTHGEWQEDPAWATDCPGVKWLGAIVRGALAAQDKV